MNKDFMQKTNVKETKQGGNAWSIHIFEEKNCFKPFWFQKIVVSSKFLGTKCFVSQRLVASKTFCVQKNNFFPKNIGPKNLGPKELLVKKKDFDQKVYGPKKFGLKKKDFAKKKCPIKIMVQKI